MYIDHEKYNSYNLIINITLCICVKYEDDMIEHMDYKENMTYLRELWGVYLEQMHTVMSLHPYDIKLMITIVKYHAYIVNYSYFASNHVNRKVCDNLFPRFSETDNFILNYRWRQMSEQIVYSIKLWHHLVTLYLDISSVLKNELIIPKPYFTRAPFLLIPTKLMHVFVIMSTILQRYGFTRACPNFNRGLTFTTCEVTV